jgi:hypothetical protein
MSKLNTHVQDFDLVQAMELANLLQLANYQFECYAEQKDWLVGDTHKLIGSKAFDFDPRTRLTSSSPIEYDLLASFWFTEVDFLKVETVPFGFIAQQPETNHIFIVFRGTRESAEWLDDLQFKQVDFLHDPTFGRVSNGFHQIYTRSFDQLNHPLKFVTEVPSDRQASICQTIVRTLQNCPAGAQVFVTGHSLGGALATLAALHIAIDTQFRYPILYTFASPRTGNAKFSQCFRDLNLQVFRIANSEDIVPDIPLASGIMLGPDVTTTMSPAQIKRINSLKRLVAIFTNNLTSQQYEHVGIPLYFTEAKGSISYNHNLETTYREALR